MDINAATFLWHIKPLGRLSFYSTRIGPRLLYVLCDTPQNAGRVKQDEVAHLPISVSRRLRSYCIFLGNLFGLNLRPPSVYISYQEVHLQVLGKLLHVVVL